MVRFPCVRRLLLVSLLAASPYSSRADAGLIDIGERTLVADLKWLVDRRVVGLPLATWPLPAAAVRDAVANADQSGLKDAERSALQRVQRTLERLAGPGEVSLQANPERHLLLDGEQRTRAQAEASVTLRHASDALLARLRVTSLHEPIARRDNGAVLDGSYLGVRGDGVVALFGVVDRWWGPGVMQSPLLSDVAPPIPTLIVRRSADTAPEPALLQWIGAWGYEFSLGRMRDYRPAGTRTIGMRFYARPTPGLELGAARFIAWGGAGNPRGFRALFDALLGNSNVEPGEPDPSNEVSGFDLRWSQPVFGDAAWAGYAHVIGEDEAGSLPTHLFGTLGLQFKHAVGAQRLEWTVEGTDTQTGRLFGFRSRQGAGAAYRHSTYVGGHYHLGLPIGALIGGGGHSLGLLLAWLPEAGSSIDRVGFSAVRARVNAAGPEPLHAHFGVPAQIDEVGLRLEARTGSVRWHVGLSVQRDTSQQRRSVGLLGGVEVPFEALMR